MVETFIEYLLENEPVSTDYRLAYFATFGGSGTRFRASRIGVIHPFPVRRSLPGVWVSVLSDCIISRSS
jgi:hypothetical protein